MFIEFNGIFTESNMDSFIYLCLPTKVSMPPTLGNSSSLIIHQLTRKYLSNLKISQYLIFLISNKLLFLFWIANTCFRIPILTTSYMFPLDTLLRLSLTFSKTLLCKIPNNGEPLSTTLNQFLKTQMSPNTCPNSMAVIPVEKPALPSRLRKKIVCPLHYINWLID